MIEQSTSNVYGYFYTKSGYINGRTITDVSGVRDDVTATVKTENLIFKIYRGKSIGNAQLKLRTWDRMMSVKPNISQDKMLKIYANVVTMLKNAPIDNDMLAEVYKIVDARLAAWEKAHTVWMTVKNSNHRKYKS